jgi:hypothetical protein
MVNDSDFWVELRWVQIGTVHMGFRLLLLLFLLVTVVVSGCRDVDAVVVYYGKNAAGDVEWEIKECSGGGCGFIRGGNRYFWYVAPLDGALAIPDSELVVGSRWRLTGIAEVDSGSQERGLYWVDAWFLKYASFERLGNVMDGKGF